MLLRCCLCLAQVGLIITERRLCGGDAGRRLRLGIRQADLCVAQRRLRRVNVRPRLRLYCFQACLCIFWAVCAAAIFDPESPWVALEPTWPLLRVVSAILTPAWA